MLAQICRARRVILVRATPLKQHAGCIQSGQAVPKWQKTAPSPMSGNLKRSFARLQKEPQRPRPPAQPRTVFQTVQSNAKATREQILKYLMIRRTRNEIMKYYGEDLKLQGMKFPDVADPQPLFYKFSKTENEIFIETVHLLAKAFTYARYKPLDVFRGRCRGTTTAEPAQPRQVHENPDGETPRKQFSRVPPDA